MQTPSASPSPSTQPPPMFQALVMWGALLASQGMIVLVSQTAMTRVTPSAPDVAVGVPASPLGSLPEWMFYLFAAVSLGLAYLIPKIAMKRVKITLGADGKITQDSFRKLLPVWIIRWALLESITLIGFLNSMLNAKPSAIFPFAAIALVGFILSFPSERKLKTAGL